MRRAPAALKLDGERRQWAEARLDEMEASRLEALAAALGGEDGLRAAFADGELRLYAGGAVVLGRIYLDEEEGKLAEAYWRYLLVGRKWSDAPRFATELRRPPVRADSAAARQFIERVEALAADVRSIEDEEAEMNERLYELYRVTPAERLVVENDKARRQA